jgi:rSAM/selenodomain-associated transferase 2
LPAPLSIIVPTLNAAATLPRCLGTLIEGLGIGPGGGLIRELIVSDGGSQDETAAVAAAAGAKLVTGPPSRGGQLRRGCTAASGQWLLILHADTCLAPGWAQSVANHIENPSAGPVYFRLQFNEPGLMASWVAGWANLRAAWLGLPYGDQGLLVSRADYRRVGGYPDQPLMEDVALVRKLGRMRGLRVIALTSAARYKRDGWLRRGSRNLWTQIRYFAGTDPEVLAARYRR